MPIHPPSRSSGLPSEKFLLNYLNNQGPKDILYTEAVQSLIASRMTFHVKTYVTEKTVELGKLSRGLKNPIPTDLLCEQIGMHMLKILSCKNDDEQEVEVEYSDEEEEGRREEQEVEEMEDTDVEYTGVEDTDMDAEARTNSYIEQHAAQNASLAEQFADWTIKACNMLPNSTARREVVKRVFDGVYPLNETILPIFHDKVKAFDRARETMRREEIDPIEARSQRLAMQNPVVPEGGEAAEGAVDRSTPQARHDTTPVLDTRFNTCTYDDCSCRRDSEFAKELFTSNSHPIAELMTRLIGEEPQPEFTARHARIILTWINLRRMGLKCYIYRESAIFP